MRRAGKASSAASRIGLGSDIKHPITSREGGGSKKTIVFASLCGEPQRFITAPSLIALRSLTLQQSSAIRRVARPVFEVAIAASSSPLRPRSDPARACTAGFTLGRQLYPPVAPGSDAC